MAAYFCDSSALVKRYAREQGTGWMQSLFRSSAQHLFYAVRLTRVETVSALVRKQRGAHLTPTAATRALARLRRDFHSRIVIVEVTTALLQRAEMLAEKHYLRGYDAVQLAAALEANSGRAGMGLASLILIAADDALLKATTVEGLSTDNPEHH